LEVSPSVLDSAELAELRVRDVHVLELVGEEARAAGVPDGYPIELCLRYRLRPDEPEVAFVVVAVEDHVLDDDLVASALALLRGAETDHPVAVLQ
jgi:hypothetical protein